MTQQTTVEELQAKFDTLKGDFHAQETAVEARQKEQTKNANILEALKQELSDLLQRTQSKLEQGETLTADEYVELKQSDTSLKARIEYYEALAEDLENLVYNERKKLFDIQQELIIIRSRICDLQASERIQKFNEKNAQELAEIFALLFLTGKYTAPPDSEITDQESTLLYLEKAIGDFIYISYRKFMPEKLKLSSPHLSEFEPKRPTQIHLEQFEAPKGLAGLLAKAGN